MAIFCPTDGHEASFPFGIRDLRLTRREPEKIRPSLVAPDPIDGLATA
jgi:hypothetical protein